MAVPAPAQELDPAELSRRLETIPGAGSGTQPVPVAIEEPPTWNEIKESDEYKALTFPDQVNLARQWGEETKSYAATLPDYTEDQGRQIDEFVSTEAVEVPANIKRASATAGVVKGAAAGMGAIAGGVGGLAVGGPVGAIAGGIGGMVAGGELAEAGLQKFAPQVAAARAYAPGYATAGEYAPSVIMGGVGARGLVTSGKALAREIGTRRAAEEIAKTAAVSGVVGGGVGTATRAVLGGEVTPATVAEDVLFSALFAGLASGTRVKGYNRDEALALNERVKAGRATEAEFRDWQGILGEAEKTQARGMAGARRTEVELGGRRVVDRTELIPGEQPQMRPQPTAELPAARPTIPELPEAGVRGIVRGTQADTAEMQRRGITSEMQETLVDLGDPVPYKPVFTVESQGINREAIIPIPRAIVTPPPRGPREAELVREGEIITPRRVLPTTQRPALPERAEAEVPAPAAEPAPVTGQPIPRPFEGQRGEAGFLITDPVEGAKKFTQKWVTSTGLLPKEAFNILEARDQRIQAMQKQIDFTMRDLANASVEANGKRVITDTQKAIIDGYLRGEVDVLTELPQPMQAPVMQMRRQIDNLSERLVEAGVFTGEKADIVMGRRGEYLTRSYEKFDNPKFSFDLLQQRNPQRLEAAVKFIEDQIVSNNPGISKAEARNQAIGRAREISTAEEGFTLDSLVNAANLGKDLSITKGRKNIPEEIRFLLGEYEDPIINYARSAVKMINLLQSQRTLTDLRDWGVRSNLFFDKPTGDASQIIAAEGSKTLEPLNGLYATPELVNAIKDFDVMVKGGDLYRAFSAVNSWVKWGKTVGSVQAQFRNPLSNIVIEIMNGNFAFTGNRQAVKTILSEFGVPAVDSPEMRKYTTRAAQLGVLDTTVLNEFYQTLKDAQMYKGDTMGFAEELSGKSANAAKKGIQALNKAYRSGDNFFKIMAWESETKALMRGKGLSREDAEVEAAERVKNTRPTYSRVFRAVKRWRNQPFFGNFMSWPSEILRTTANSVRYAAQDFKDPNMRFHGAKRLIGLSIGVSIGTGIAKAFMWATDFNDRKLNAVRRFVAPYQKNATLAPTGIDENGDIGYIDISYTDPLEVFRGPIIAAGSGRDPEEGLLNSTREFLEAYLGPSILVNSLASAIYGRTPQNREIRNPQDPALDQLADTVTYMLRQNEPATLSQMRRIYYALTGTPDVTVSKYGRIYKPGEELSAVFGIRPQSINLSKALEAKASRFNTAISDVSRIFTETYGAAGRVPEENIREQYNKMDNRRRALFDEANKDFHAAMLLGMTREEAVGSMTAGGMSRQNAISVANNRYRDYTVSRSLQRQMRKTLTPEEVQRREAVRREIEMGVE
jgi:hypothetical protein